MAPRTFKKVNVAVSGTFPGYKQCNCFPPPPRMLSMHAGDKIAADIKLMMRIRGLNSGPQGPGRKPRRHVQLEHLVGVYAFDNDAERRGEEEC